MNNFSIQKNNKDELKLFMLNNIINIYNKLVKKYTNSFRGLLSSPTTDKLKIPKKYISINDYINSKKQWLKILNFMSENVEIDINDYLDIMIKNWNTIALSFNMKQSVPVFNIIFSSKMINYYTNLKQKEEQSIELNKHLALKHDDNFYLLAPSLQSNINSLFRLKKLNSDLLYHEIIEIFPGEFEKEFIKIIKLLPEENITQENIVKKLK